MNIAIDISPLQTGHNGRGVGVYTKKLVEALQMYEKDHSFSLITHQHDIPESCSLVHYPYFDPFFMTLPLIRKYPSVVTIHDMIPLVFPEKFPSGVKGALRFQMQKLSLLGVSRVITDSNTSKKDICRILRRSPDSVDVVYLAPSVEKKSSKESVPNSATNAIANGIPYILYVGDVNWNKNVLGLIQAFSLSRKKIPSLHLVLVGNAFCDTALSEVVEIHSLISKLALGPYIHMPGFVTQPELSALYARALCLVQPSFYEGFGFPVVDAMSLGCPVISSNTSSLKEIAGPSFLVDPESPTSISDGIQRVASLASEKKKKMISDGLEWVSQYSWKRVAKETMASYVKALL